MPGNRNGGVTPHRSPTPQNAAGGQGVLLQRGNIRGDLVLIRRAIRLGWDIPQPLLDRLGLETASIALDQTRDVRARVAAARVCLAGLAQEIEP